MFTKIQNAILERTSAFVQSKLILFESGHDWWHTWRVLKLASYLAQKENADAFVCSLAALLHDVSDQKFTEIRNDTGVFVIEKYLTDLNLDKSTRNIILYIVENISFGTGLSVKLNKSIEFQVVQDADMLDAIGAIGIARTFNYGGFRNRLIHFPGSSPIVYSSTEAYRKSDSTTIMHFYEKLLSLKSLMNTKTALAIAIKRHQYMVDFLNMFLFEWDEFPELD